MLGFYCLMGFLLFLFWAISLGPVVAYVKKSENKGRRSDFALLSALIVFSSTMAIFLYLKWGASGLLKEQYAVSKIPAVVHEKANKKEDIQEVIKKLAAYLDTHQHDAKGWYLLGRLYLDQNQLQKAIKAFHLSLINDPQNTEIMAQYAQVLYFEHNALTEQSKHLIRAVLSQDPQNAIVLNLLAVDAFTHHRYEIAATYWKRLRNLYPENSQEFDSLTKAINIAESKNEKE